MTGRGLLSSFTGIGLGNVPRKFFGTLAVLPESFAQNLSNVLRDMVIVATSMDPLIAKNTDLKRSLARAIGSVSGLGSTFQSFEIEAHETLIKRFRALIT